MYRSALFLSATFCGTQIALVQTVVQAKTKVEIGRIAKSITLRIETVGAYNPGSGVLLKREGNVYTVLTAAHVLTMGKAFRLVTPDNVIYQSISVSKADNNLDLAVVKFRSDQNYQVAEIGTSNSLEIGSEIYVAGFPSATSTIVDGVFQSTPGNVTGTATRPDSSGYSLIYDSITWPGMSGGPILNGEGQLVGIHGRGDKSADGQQKTGFNLGITIERFGTVAALLDAKPVAEIAAIPPTTKPRSADFLLAGNEKENSGNYKGALQDYNQAIRLNPRNAYAYFNRGVLKHIKLDDIPGALADYSKAIKLNPQQVAPYSNRGLLRYEKLHDVSGALADYNKAIKLNPKRALTYLLRGVLKKEKTKDRQGAIQDLQQAARLLRQEGETSYLQKTLDQLKELGVAESDDVPIAPKRSSGKNLNTALPITFSIGRKPQ